MTQREFFNAIVNGNVTEAEVEFAKAQIAKLDATNEKRRNSQTKTQKANEGIKAEIMAMFAENEIVTAKMVHEALGISTQKASPLLGQLAKAGKIEGTRPKASAPIEFRLVKGE